jgi:cyclophilin family peptidyl-prolyl cis-trans isomerase
MKTMMSLIGVLMVTLVSLIGQIPEGAKEEGAVNGSRKAVISTEFGDMTILLYDDTPLHRDNFIKNVEAGWYDNTLFHRVMPYFMMQGGDPNSIGAGPTQPLGVDRCVSIPAEIRPHHFHKKGALAAARLPDNTNPERASSGCQFFVVQGYQHNDTQLAGLGKPLTAKQRAWYKVRGGYPFLDNDYTVFGEVIDGLEVIDLICAVESHNVGALKDRPIEDVKMTIKMIN